MPENVFRKCDFCEGFGVYAKRKIYSLWLKIIDDIIEFGIANDQPTAVINSNIDNELKRLTDSEPVCPACNGAKIEVRENKAAS